MPGAAYIKLSKIAAREDCLVEVEDVAGLVATVNWLQLATDARTDPGREKSVKEACRRAVVNQRCVTAQVFDLDASWLLHAQRKSIAQLC